jgi:adenylate cyclase
MVRRIRLWSGLVLFSFVLTHFLNHALGIHSLEWLEAGRAVFVAFWRSIPATIVFYSALFLHVFLIFWLLYQRRSLIMAPWEFWQMLLGFTIPPLLVLHILGTRFVHEVFGIQDSYLAQLLIFFVFSPDYWIKQFIAILVVWIHGCIGLHFWLRFKPWYPRVLPYGAALALLVPVLAAVGTFVAGRQIVALAQDPVWIKGVQATVKFASNAQAAQIGFLENIVLGVLVAFLAVSLLARVGRRTFDRLRGLIHLTYPDGRRVAVAQGTTILEASRGAGIPHASVCGGRGRCSTCRVRIGVGGEELPPSSVEEQRVLDRVGAPPNQRLACQTRPLADLEVSPILPHSVSPRQAAGGPGYLQGQEREIAILFADLRGFTTLAEHKLPYDVVFILNRYFAAMGSAVEASGGRLDKFIGDGVMALFGIERGPEIGSRNALAAAKAMAERLEELNRALANDLETPLRIGIGIHVGPVIVGEMGYGAATSVTAIGDAVNTASRLETMTKEFGVQLVISDPVAEFAGLDAGRFPHHHIEVRGRKGGLTIRVIEEAGSLELAETSGSSRPLAAEA